MDQFNSEWSAPPQQQHQQQPPPPPFAGTATTTAATHAVPGAFPRDPQFFPTSYSFEAASGVRSSSATIPGQQQAVRISGTPVSDGGHGQSSFGGSSSSSGEPLHRLRFGFPEDDLPLLEELGINPQHIWAKSLVVLNPLRRMEAAVVEDTDLAGPLTFAVLLGCLLSLQGKVEFGAIYSLSLIGTFMATMLLTLMSDQSVGIPFVVSALGYCLLPSIVLATLRVMLLFLSSPNGFMVPMAMVSIAWSGWCASQMFVTSLGLHHQKYLLLYPALLFYAILAAITIF